ncbi:hypothetical protein GCM10009839_85150 [Catenulispora yoronensis]|uniref:DUF3558 domain-containing protein n=1 Tax=Catenulispora yoronensis TaxID=450799 RepID=A0ABN2VFT2_9ACTN
MRRRTWGIAAACVVVLAAAGTTALLVASGDDGGDYKALPTCEKLGSALPGKPTLTVGENVTSTEPVRGMLPAFTNIECKADTTQVRVDLYQASNMDLKSGRSYQDKAVHDGSWRANEMFTQQTPQFDELKPGVRYGSISYTDSTCTVITVKRNATVMVTVPNPAATGKHSLEEWKAACRTIAENQVPKVVDAALG